MPDSDAFFFNGSTVFFETNSAEIIQSSAQKGMMDSSYDL